MKFCINHSLNWDYPFMFRHYIYIAVLWLLACTAVCSAGAQDSAGRRSRRILYLNSYNNGYAWSDNILEGIRSVLPVESRSLNFQMEYLDAKRYENEQIQKVLFHYFKAKFVRDRFDLTLTSASTITPHP